MSAEKKRTLFVFDFDNTLVEGNSDSWLWTAPLPGGRVLPEEAVSQLRQKHSQWTEFMNHVMGLLHDEGVRQTAIVEHMKK